MRRLVTAAIASAILAAVPGAPALAQPGVHVDPGSPAGKEYALPLDQARRDAKGESGPGSSSRTSRSAPLFGEGIEPADGGSAPGGEKGPGRGGAGGNDRAKPGTAARLTATTDTTGDSPLLVDGGIALAVLVAAGVFALALRRVLRQN